MLIRLTRTVRALLRPYRPRHAARTAPAPRTPDPADADRALVAAMNAGRWTALDYLHAIGFPEAERYASAFGREAAKAWRARYGADPFAACGAYVNGRIRLVFGYPDTGTLQAAAWEYKRTAEFLHNRRTEALHALAA